jgi:D-3-phosphoglycerate dehydrogenase
VKILVVRLAHKIDDAFLERYPSLIALVTPTTGLNHIELSACENRGVQVFSLNDCQEAIKVVTSTSELTFGLMMALLRHISQAHQDVIGNCRWDRDRFRSRQLSRLTLGIVGIGRIGSHLSSYAKAFGMRVLGCDPYQPSTRFADLGIEQCELSLLLKEADIVSLHANLRDDNHGLLGEKEISLMRANALLVNTARGELVDELAITKAIQEGRLAGVAVDVLAHEFNSEPWKDSPLVKVARDGGNVLITPHLGGCTSDAMHITEECLAEYVVKVMREVL